MDRRLLVAAERSDFPVQNNRYAYICTSAAKLLDCGFTLHKDGYEGEIAEHYSVDLGSPPTLSDAERFLEAFDRKEETSR